MIQGTQAARQSAPTPEPLRLGVVVPCYRTGDGLPDLLRRIGPEVDHIIVVDDACPAHSTDFLREGCADPRIVRIVHPANRGVGGATVSGWQQALALGCDVVVKLDGDGQYDPALIPRLVAPIAAGWADCAKGNRFFHIEDLAQMPTVRLIGNSVLSFVNKLVSGYWDIMDPTNGFIAIRSDLLRSLPLDKLEPRYFFESDLWFRLSIARAVLVDVPLPAAYRGERSGLSPLHSSLTFPAKYLQRFAKRIFYNYFLRDFNIGSVNLLAGTLLLGAGGLYGATKWGLSLATGVTATAGEVMIAALPVLFGANLLISFVNYDVNGIPRTTLSTNGLSTTPCGRPRSRMQEQSAPIDPI